MTDRDCANCKHHTEDGCSSWDCEYEPKDLISRADAIDALMNLPTDTIHSHFDDGYSLGVEHAIAHIKALPQAEYSKILQTTLNGDLVKRADAIEAVKETKPIVRSTERNWGKMIAEQHSKELVKALKALPSADAVSRESYIKAVGYVEWLEKLIIDSETFEWLCEDTNDREWCEKNCNYSSIQAECLRHLYEAKQSAEAVHKPDYSYEADMVRRLKEAQSAEAVQGEWIPCSERFPKAEDMYQPPEQRYLCQLEAHGVRKFCVLSRLKGAVSPFWDWYGIAVYDSEVIAWMPLPTPYKGGDDE